jgi:hypothetical protein
MTDNKNLEGFDFVDTGMRREQLQGIADVRARTGRDDLYTDPGDSPFLTIITRNLLTHKRERLLAANRKSVAAQTYSWYEQMMILDGRSRGRRWSASALVVHLDRIRGKYVTCLDDDDQFLTDDALRMIAERVATNDYPDVIVWRMEDPRGFTSPMPDSWNTRPVVGCMGQSFACKREVFAKFAWLQAAPDERHGDGTFLQAVWDAGHTFYWLDEVLTRRNAIGALDPEVKD